MTEKIWKKPETKYKYIVPRPTLKKGSKGQKVKNLQKFLNWYGKIALKLDGEFGEKTRNAVKKFQKTEGLKEDGIYGEKSYKAALKYKEIKKTYIGIFPDLVQNGRDRIYNTAVALAWPKGTAKSKYKYPNGRPTDAFKKAIKKVYKNRVSWSRQCRRGASCDVGAGTVIRYSGVDKKISRALAKQIPYLQKSDIFKKTKVKSVSSMKPGDIGIYLNKGPGGHIWISIGNKKIVEANHTAKYFLHVDTDNYTSSNKKLFEVYRCNVPIAIKSGDMGLQVTRLQRFLKWAGFNCGEIDGVCGMSTAQAIKEFQTSVGLNPDGVFGSESLVKAKKVEK